MFDRGYDNRNFLSIKLNDGNIKIKSLPKKLKFKGGRNLISNFIFEEVEPNIHPLSIKNNIYIAPGLLSGTSCPNSGRCSIGAKSPLTGGIKESNAGGTIATYIAKMGIALLKIEGKSNVENVIYIEDTGNSEDTNSINITLHKIKNINGKLTYEATKCLQDKFGKDISIMLIGPAGERRYLSSCLCVTDIDGKPTRQAGRGGLGAVLGSKGIKAIVIQRPKVTKIKYNDKNSFKENVKELIDILKNCPSTSLTLPKYGTNLTMESINDLGGLPTRNFSSGEFEGVDKIGGEALRKMILKRGANPTHACMPGCIIQCSNTYIDNNKEEITGGFEYECIWALGANCGIDDLDYIAYMNRICDDLGIDCIEMGNTIAVIMESGYISFGDKKGAVKLLNEIKKDTPIGKIVASGCVTAGKIFGVERVPHVKGQGIPGYDPRAIKGIGVTYATSPMGADHTAGFTPRNEVFGIGKTIDPLKTKGKVELSKQFQKMTALIDSIGLCIFVDIAIRSDERGLKPVISMLNSKYNLKLTEKDLYKIGNEILNTEREFNIKCGINKYADDVPEYMRTEKLDTLKSVFDVKKEDLLKF